MPIPKNRQKMFIYLIALLSASGYIFIAYFLERHETSALLTTYFFLFLCYLAILWNEGIFNKQESSNLKTLTYLAIAFRLCLARYLLTHYTQLCFFARDNATDHHRQGHNKAVSSRWHLFFKHLQHFCIYSHLISHQVSPFVLWFEPMELT